MELSKLERLSELILAEQRNQSACLEAVLKELQAIRAGSIAAPERVEKLERAKGRRDHDAEQPGSVLQRELPMLTPLMAPTSQSPAQLASLAKLNSVQIPAQLSSASSANPPVFEASAGGRLPRLESELKTRLGYAWSDREFGPIWRWLLEHDTDWIEKVLIKVQRRKRQGPVEDLACYMASILKGEGRWSRAEEALGKRRAV